MRRFFSAVFGLVSVLALVVGVQSGARAAEAGFVLTMKVDAAPPAGVLVPLTGRLVYHDRQGNERPMAGEEIRLRRDRGETPATRTGPDGSYRLETRFELTEDVSMYWEGDGGASWFASSDAVQVRPVYRTVFKKFAVRYGADGTVTLSAGFDAPVSLAEDPWAQFSTNGSTGWKNIRRAPYRGGQVKLSLIHRRNGYWRLHYGGDKRYTTGTSPVRKVFRWNTSIRAFKVSPRRLRVGDKVTVSGVLYRHDGRRSGIRFARQKVYVVFRCTNKKVWEAGAIGRTDAEGRFKVRVETFCDAHWAAVFSGSSGTYDAASRTVAVDTFPRSA